MPHARRRPFHQQTQHQHPMQPHPTFADLDILHAYLENIDALMIEKFMSRDKALDLAVKAGTERLNNITELRDKIREQNNQLLSREEYNSAHGALVKLYEDVHLELAQCIVKVDNYERTSAVERAQMDKRQDAMDEFRGQFKDQVASFIIRTELNALLDTVNHETRRISDLLPTFQTTTSQDATDNLLDTRIKHIESKFSNWEGRFWAIGAFFLVLNAVISWYLGVGHPAHLPLSGG